MKKKIIEKLDLPPTYKYIIKHFFSKQASTVLDLGCGKGVAAKVFNSKKKYSFTGVDIFKPYLMECNKLKLYVHLIKTDLLKFNPSDNSYDCVLLFQVIEHIEKKQSVHLIKKAIKIARKQVIITTPNGVCKQHAYDNNKYQEHHSVWSANDLRRLGFRVYGQGLKQIYGSESYGDGGKTSSLIQKIAMIYSLLVSPIIFLKPEWGAQLIAVKNNK